jgi:hypothetical protein
LQERLTAHAAAMDIERDAIHPGQHHVLIAQLAQAFPAFDPCGLRRLLSGIVRQAARYQKTYRQVVALFVSGTVFFSCHVALNSLYLNDLPSSAFVSEEKQFQYHGGYELARINKLCVISYLDQWLAGNRLVSDQARITGRAKFSGNLIPFSFWDHIHHIVFVDVFVADLERPALMPEDRESERRIETLRGGLVVAHGQDNSLQSGECRGALQHFAEQAPRDTLATILMVYKHTPDSGFVPLLAASLAPESDRTDQRPIDKGAHHIVIVARGR